MARRNARWFIAVLQNLSTEELARIEQDDDATKRIWKQVSPSPPFWIQQIVGAMHPWGFVFYKTSDVERKHGHDLANYWETIRKQTRFVPYASWDERSMVHACLRSVHCGGNRHLMESLWTEDWPSGPAAGDLCADRAVRA